MITEQHSLIDNYETVLLKEIVKGRARAIEQATAKMIEDVAFLRRLNNIKGVPARIGENFFMADQTKSFFDNVLKPYMLETLDEIHKVEPNIEVAKVKESIQITQMGQMRSSNLDTIKATVDSFMQIANRL